MNGWFTTKYFFRTGIIEQATINIAVKKIRKENLYDRKRDIIKSYFKPIIGSAIKESKNRFPNKHFCIEKSQWQKLFHLRIIVAKELLAMNFKSGDIKYKAVRHH